MIIIIEISVESLGCPLFSSSNKLKDIDQKPMSITEDRNE